MKRMYNPIILNDYVEKYDIEKYFNEDMKPFLELLLFNRGDHICKDGEKMDYLFFFIEGRAKVYTVLKNGKSLLLCFYNSVKVIGDVEFMNSEAATSNIQVIEDSYCIAIPMEKVREHLINDAKFLLFMCKSLGQKLNRLSKNSSINLLYPLENRLASYILATGITIENSGIKVLVFNENLTEISELLGTSYRHILRTLKILCENGVIKKKDSSFEVVDKHKLISLSADLYK